MKTLFILRHAEAAPGSPDEKRDLTPAGRAAAEHMGEIMRDKAYLPDAIFCSPATRTRETLKALALKGPKPVFKREIYQADTARLVGIVRGTGKPESLLLVGHNPAIHGLAAALAGRGKQDLLQSVWTTFQPGTLAVLQFEESWQDIGPGAGLLTDVIVP